jgi:shikimate kinase
MQSKSVLLIGMRGAGKTTVGKLVAEKLGWTFVDLDVALEHSTNRSIPSIVDEDGWDSFRKKELDVLTTILAAKSHNHVLACSGGTVETDAARQVLHDHVARGGVLAWVHRDMREVFAYLTSDKSRPASMGVLQTVRQDLSLCSESIATYLLMALLWFQLRLISCLWCGQPTREQPHRSRDMECSIARP